MPDYGYFFNSKQGDRVYDADSMTDWLLPFFTTGVFHGQLQVKANDNMSVTIEPGYCNIGGKTRHFEEQTVLDLEVASGTLNRIDTVILRRNDTDRNIYLMIQTGGASKSPTAPEIVRGDVIYDLKLAEIHITAGTIKITQADITDCRMLSDVCGWVAATVKEIDFTQIQAQFDSYLMQFQTNQVNKFTAWFNNIKQQFTGDVVNLLQIQIDNKLDKDGKAENSKAADKLNTNNVGSSTQPVHFVNGLPVVCDGFDITNIGGVTSKNIHNGDFNNVKQPGFYSMTGTPVNSPVSGRHCFSLLVLESDNLQSVHQIAIMEAEETPYIRYGIPSINYWKKWIKIGISDSTQANLELAAKRARGEPIFSDSVSYDINFNDSGLSVVGGPVGFYLGTIRKYPAEIILTIEDAYGEYFHQNNGQFQSGHINGKLLRLRIESENSLTILEGNLVKTFPYTNEANPKFKVRNGKLLLDIGGGESTLIVSANCECSIDVYDALNFVPHIENYFWWENN